MKVEPEISVVLPAHNEAGRIAEAVKQTKKSLDEISSSFEIIIAEDGSTDGTAEIARLIEAEEPYVRHIHSVERLGKGKALSRAFRLAKGETLAFLDVDLSTDMRHLKELIEAVRSEGYDFATGSRLLKGSEVTRSFKRKVMSIVYNLLVRTVLKSELRDHQCGFKSFRRESLLNIIEKVEDGEWFWDTELLVRAQREGYRVKEFPIRWDERGGTKVETLRDGLRMLSKIIKLYHQLR
ncbi:MAG: dolichyl-phosphate beta-glucosyltransferase [Candidatus Methanospirareceae archaeon]